MIGLIPAHAGKTQDHDGENEGGEAHPRSRGENGANDFLRTLVQGSSPLTRGKHCVELRVRLIVGLIPAHAGKTLPDLRLYRADRSDLGKP